MDSGQQTIPPSGGQVSPKLFARASARRRLMAAIVFFAIAGAFAALWLVGHYEITLYPFACGFRQLYGLPCPTCGMTHAVLAFAQGQVIRSFCTQPAAGFFCMLLVVIAFFAFLMAALGIYSPALERHLVSLKVRYIVAAVLLIFFIGWAVTLAMALAERSGH